SPEGTVPAGGRHAALAGGRRDALHRAESDVAAGEDPGDAGLEEVRVAVELPPPGCAHVGACEHVALRVECDLRWEPRGLGVRADEDEQPTGRDPGRLPGPGVSDVDLL